VSTALRIKVSERVDGPDPNAGPVIPTATVTVHRVTKVDGAGLANVDVVDVTVEAPGYESYVSQPYNLSTALAPPGQAEPPITRVSLRRL
jgi:hypothetical protein